MHRLNSKISTLFRRPIDDLWNAFVDLSPEVIEHSNNFLHRMWIRLNDIYVHVIFYVGHFSLAWFPFRFGYSVDRFGFWYNIQLYSPKIKIHFAFNLSDWQSHAYERRSFLSHSLLCVLTPLSLFSVSLSLALSLSSSQFNCSCMCIV